jgi:two-component system chemotaxis sensor kinase CheA
LVARLEEIDVKQIEFVDGQHVVQYRGQLMPIIRMSDGYNLRQEGRQPILVFADGDHSMGLAVDEIVDIVESEMNVELSSKQRSIIGSAVIAGQATEIIDVSFYLERAFGDWFKARNKTAAGAKSSSRKILLVDDSPFFRNMLAPLLTVAGYQVTTAENAETALKLRDTGELFDVIISDIEMPGMNGFDFARQVTSGDSWKSTPVVALSAHASPEDFARGREAGFSDYVAKFDRDALLQILSQTIETRGAA